MTNFTANNGNDCIIGVIMYLYSSQLPLQFRNNKKGSEFRVIPIPIMLPRSIPVAGRALEDSALKKWRLIQHPFPASGNTF